MSTSGALELLFEPVVDAACVEKVPAPEDLHLRTRLHLV